VKTSTDVYTCQAVTENPLVLFMKGSPEAPQCGFSRAVVQILDVNVSGIGLVLGTLLIGSGRGEGEDQGFQLSSGSGAKRGHQRVQVGLCGTR
jgi:hypothetical protein